MKKTRYEAMKKLVEANPKTDEEWFDAISDLQDSIEKKRNIKFHVKIIDFIKGNKEIIILGVIMTTISLLHSEIYLFFKSLS